MNYPKTEFLLCLIIFGSTFTACRSKDTSPGPIGISETATRAPIELATSAPGSRSAIWRVSSPEAQGMDSYLLVELLKQIENEGHDIDAIIIARNGAIVLEATVFPFSIFPEARHDLFSCTKSVISILIGIAIDKGFIRSVDQKVIDFFPQNQIKNLDERKRSMTVADLLTMSSGLDCRDSYLYRWEGMHQMRQQSNWAEYVLNLPMVDDPGKRFEYCNGASMLLSSILLETTGTDAMSFADQHLFSPLGIEDKYWESDPSGVSIGYAELQLRPVDLAKIGQLLLNGGVWEGEEIVSSNWIETSTRAHMRGTLQEKYGYHWWVDDDTGAIMALGYQGQYLIVLPDENLVVVFMSDLSEDQFYLPDQLFQQHVLPSIQSDYPLPENSRATLLLKLYGHALRDN